MAPTGRVRLLLVKYAGRWRFAWPRRSPLRWRGRPLERRCFPIGPVTLLSGDGGPSRPRPACGLVLIAAVPGGSLAGLSAIGLFLSTLTVVPVGAMAATVVLSVVSPGPGPVAALEWLHPWLFTHYWFGLGDLLRQPVLWDSFASNALLQTGYMAGFGALAYGRFVTKDVLS